MSVLERIHGGYVQRQRLERLVRHLEGFIPRNASVADVGCGDGQLAAKLHAYRPDLKIEGIDVLKRPRTWIPVRQFDGRTLPYASGGMDVVLLVDVLHHVEQPEQLLREAIRVARGSVVIKDHLSDGWLAEPTLRFMDRIGNARYGVALPGNYWRLSRWKQAFEALAVKPVQWRDDLKLYPPGLDVWFGRSLHFITKLEAA
jgi:SAM-dependent methyltransferase